MTTEVKEVTDAIQAVTALKEDAKRLRTKITDATTRGQNAMGRVETAIVDPLLAAVTELEALTATMSNFPPE
jgi:phage shock protein A